MFKPGISGNPSGRPVNHLQVLLRKKKKLPQELYNAVHPLLKSKKEATIIWAAEFLRDTTWGKPAQELQHTGEGGKQIIVEITSKSG